MLSQLLFSSSMYSSSIVFKDKNTLTPYDRPTLTDDGGKRLYADSFVTGMSDHNPTLSMSNPFHLPPAALASQSQIDVTILRGHSLPRLKTSLGRNRYFYVVVTDGVNVKKTTTQQSVAQVVQWNQKLGVFGGHTFSHIEARVYAKRTIGADILVGKQRIPSVPQNDAPFVLKSVDKTGGNSGQQVTLYLSIAVSTVPSSPLAADISTSNTEMTERHIPTATGPPNPPIHDPVETAEPIALQPLLIQVDGHRVEQSPLVPQVADLNNDTKMLVNALDNADQAIKAIPGIDTWKNTIEKMGRVMDALSPFAELHPCAKMAFGLLSKIPQIYLQQVERDENVQDLLKAMHDGFDFAQEARVLRDIQPGQAQILKLMLQHVCNGCDFIQAYAKDDKFRTRFLKNISGEVDIKIKDYCETLEQFRSNLLDRAAITTEINTFQILDDVGILSANVKDISSQLEWVLKMVGDNDLDTKINGIPYKPAQHPGVERDYLPGTRMKFLDYIVDWVDSPGMERGLVLFGQAGTGKSSIAHEIARRFREMNRLSSHFVFLRTEQSKRNDYLLLTTLVRDLSNRYPSFKTALGAAIGKNQVLREAHDYRTLFEELLLRPLRDVHLVGPILVVIDALDESGDASGEHGLHTFLAKSISRLPSEFRILITSRREKDIDIALNEASSVRIVEMTDPKLATTTDDDIRAYLRARLPQNVFEKYGKDLESKAEGLFQWAAVACRYVRRPPPGFTINRCIRSLLDPSSNAGELVLLDRLYKDILEGYFKSPEVRPLFRSVMGQLFAAFEPLSIRSLSLLRQHGSHSEDEDEDSVSAIVSHLGSLLSNVTPADSSLPVAPLHTSFRDFLTDEKKSGEFCVDLRQAHYDLADYCLGLMLDKLKFNICELGSSYIANKDVLDLEDRIKKHVPKALSYACRFWDDHLEHLEFTQGLFNRLAKFFDKDFLSWLEVLSLTGDVAAASSALLVLKTWLVSEQYEFPHPLSNRVEQFKEFIKDASTFVRYFGMPIAKSAPHIYVSCLPFAPTSSYVSRQYAKRISPTLSLERGRLPDWPALEMVIPAHGFPGTVSFSPDGLHIISGSGDGTVRMWHARTGEMAGEPFTGHTEEVSSASFSPDGQHIISGSHDCTIRMWNARMGQMVGEPFTGHTDAVLSVSFSPDGRNIISGSYDRTIRMWNVRTGKMVGEPFTGHTKAVSSVLFSPDGRHIVSGSHDCTIRIWNARTREMAGKPFTGHTEEVSSVSFSPDGLHIVSCSYDRTIRMWNTRTGEMVGEPITGHTEAVSSVSFSLDGQHIVSGAHDCTIRMWNARTGEMVREIFDGHTNTAWSVSFSPDGLHIISCSYDRTIRMWNTRMGEMIGEPFKGHTDIVCSVSFSPDGQHIISGSHDCTIRMWNARTGEIAGEPFTGHTSAVTSVSFSPDGRHIISGSFDCTIRMWNARTGEMAGEPFTGHANAVTSVSFSHDGQHIISGSHDRTIRMWNARTREMVGEPFTGHTNAVTSVSFSPDGRHIVSGSHDRTIRMWNTRTREMVGKPFTGHTGEVCSVSFSPDGQHIVSGSLDHTIRMWNTRTGEMVGEPFTGHSNIVWSVSFSPDGRHIISGSHDCTIRMWNARTGEMMGEPFTGYTEAVYSVSFSPDGQHVVSASDDQTLQLCNTFTNLAKEVPIDESLHFTDHSVINDDGWIYGPKGELFLWIPQLHRASLHRPSTVWVAGPHETVLDLSKFVHGRNWSQCLGQG